MAVLFTYISIFFSTRTQNKSLQQATSLQNVKHNVFNCLFFHLSVCGSHNLSRNSYRVRVIVGCAMKNTIKIGSWNRGLSPDMYNALRLQDDCLATESYTLTAILVTDCLLCGVCAGFKNSLASSTQ
jgi:hypothetical protein